MHSPISLRVLVVNDLPGWSGVAESCVMAGNHFDSAVKLGSAPSAAELGMLGIQAKKYDEAAQLFKMAEEHVGTSNYRSPLHRHAL